MKLTGLLRTTCLVVALAGSGAGAVVAGAQPVEQAVSKADSELAGDIRKPDFSDSETIGDARRDFRSKWPNEIETYPDLVSILADRRAQNLSGQKQEWQAAISEFAGMQCVTCVTRSYSDDWEVMADTPRFLSLGMESHTYTGGAHGMSFFDALIWDKQESVALRPIDLFVGPVALENVAFGHYCEALHQQRSKRRGLDPAKESKFDNCPSVEKLVISVSAYDGDKLDRIEFLAAPYVAGPYAEGSYQMTIPLTQQIIDVIKPQYREAFASGS